MEEKHILQLLEDRSLISSKDSQAIYKEVEASCKSVWELLVESDLISKEKLYLFLESIADIEYLELSENMDLNQELLNCVPTSLIYSNNLLPIKSDKKSITVVLSDPFQIFQENKFKLMTGKEICFKFSDKKIIQRLIAKYCGSTKKLEEILSIQDEISNVNTEENNNSAIYNVEDIKISAPAVKIVNFLLKEAIEIGASDIHIEQYFKKIRIRFRIDGVLYEKYELSKSFQNLIVSRIKVMCQLDISEKRLPQDGRIRVQYNNMQVDLRISICPTAFGEKVTIRLLFLEMLQLETEKLGMSDVCLAKYKSNIRNSSAIVLVTGPTGSGKSTTLYSTLKELNNSTVNIITIEDPVEYQLEGINQVQVKENIGLDFASGLRSFLRQDPDVIMVGEIRDSETAKIAVNAALTGHLVLSTLHTNDAAGAISRLNNMGIPSYLLASSVGMVIAQRLLRIVCPKCREAYTVDEKYLYKLGASKEEIHKYVESGTNMTLYKSQGCEHCSGTGYKGRVGCFEILEIDSAIKELITDQVSSHVINDYAVKNGMITLMQDCRQKLFSGRTTVEEYLRVLGK